MLLTLSLDCHLFWPEVSKFDFDQTLAVWQKPWPYFMISSAYTTHLLGYYHNPNQRGISMNQTVVTDDLTVILSVNDLTTTWAF